MLYGVYRRLFLIIVASRSRSSFCRLISFALSVSTYQFTAVCCMHVLFRSIFFGWRGVIVAFRVFIMLSMRYSTRTGRAHRIMLIVVNRGAALISYDVFLNDCTHSSDVDVLSHWFAVLPFLLFLLFFCIFLQRHCRCCCCCWHLFFVIANFIKLNCTNIFTFSHFFVAFYGHVQFFVFFSIWVGVFCFVFNFWSSSSI